MVIKHKFIFASEGAWSDGRERLLCLDTGTWRVARPVLNREKCNYCSLCTLYCPPQCMKDMGSYYLTNLEFCKGCGVCARECPRGAISMVSEGEFDNDSSEG
jgi:2-oxoacid:acceptor oxidoreductase delta subunit (pyruvate/2-ketoisovalerate family)